MTEDEVLAALRTAHTRHREAVTVAELAWACAAEIELAHRGNPGLQVTVDPTRRDRAMLHRRLTALRQQGRVALIDGQPQRWRPAGGMDRI